jgi:hypothetical protein
VQEIAGRFQLRQRLAQVNDVDAVARVEDEGLHLGVPTPGLMPEMDAGVQQFLNANADHNFPFVRSSRRPVAAANHPAEHGINLSVVMAARLHTKADSQAVLPSCQHSQRDWGTK